MIPDCVRTASKNWTRLALVFALLINTQFSVLASYKVVFKDGRVIEATAKPVSMDGQYIIRATDNKTYGVPLSQINFPATGAANQSNQSKPTLPVSTQQTRASADTLTNRDVLDMHKIGLSPEVILAKMKSSPCSFDTSVTALQELKALGISDAVVLAVVQSTSSFLASPQLSEPAKGNPVAQTATSPLALHDGTPLRLRLNRNLSSADARVGDSVDFEVLDDVKVDDVVVVARGAVALATITEAHSKRRMGRAGKLNLNIDSVRLVNDQKIALRAVKETKGGGNTGKMTAAIVATSIVFFPAAPLFLFVSGKDIAIPKGTEITAYVNGEITLDAEKFVARK
jgi:hypothetical protein